MKSRIKILIISFICLSMVLPWTPVTWAEATSLTKEQELGLRFHRGMSSSRFLLDDPIANKYYQSITGRILKGAGLKLDQYNFYIANSAGLHVFAIPGGNIYMHAATIINLENEGQLASIVAHEVAHVTSNHTSSHYARLMEAASSLSLECLSHFITFSFLRFQRDSGSRLAHPLCGSAPGIGYTLTNSQADEFEADKKARQYLTKAGYNTRDMYGAFRIMVDKTYHIDEDYPIYLSIHPALTSRLAGTFNNYKNSPPSPSDLKYQAFRDRVLALSGGSRRGQNIMNNRLNSNKSDHSALHALGLLAVRTHNLSQADQLMNQALSLDPGNREYLADLGDLALNRRNPEEAKKYYEQAGLDNSQVVLGLARASELLGENNRAATLYDQAINMETTPYPKAFHWAGRFFTQNGQEAKGNYYLGRCFVIWGDVKGAMLHYQQTANDPDAGEYKAMANHEIDILTALTDKQ